jgi:hypothetical protein
MAQTGYTPISIYYSSTATNVPTAGNLIAGELAINTADGKLFYKDSAGVVQTIASKGTGTIGGSTTQVQYNNAGAFAGSANFVWDNSNVRLGIGTSSPTNPLSITSTNPLGILLNQSTSTSAAYAQFTNTTNSFYFGVDNSAGTGFVGSAYSVNLYGSGAYPMVFSTNSTERMRISSAGILAINNTSPKTWYSPAGVAQFGLAGALYGNTGVNQIKVLNNLYYDAGGNSLYTNNGYSQDLTLDGSGNFIFYSSASGTAGGTVTELERMRIDSSGNVGIGGVPSAWSQGRAIELNNSGDGIWGAGVADLYLASNCYYNSGWRYASNSVAGAGNFEIYGGAFYFTGTTTAGTAGAAASFVNILQFKKDQTLTLQGATLSNGTGVAFPATQSASSDANTLDDYEEGTFSPTIYGSGTAGTVTYAAQTGVYTKIGRLVSFQIYVQWSAGTGTGDLKVGNLPFTAAGYGSYPAVTIGYINNVVLAANRVADAYVNSGTTYINMETYPLGGGTQAAIAYDGAGEFILNGSYTI